MSGHPTSDPIIVTGMHGSLVTPIAALLSQLGVPLVGAAAGGTGDPSGVLELHRRILVAGSGSEDGWHSGGAEGKFDRSALAGFEAAALAAVSEAWSSGMRGWADPRSALVLDWLDDQVGESSYVMLYRPPWDVLASLEPTGFSPEVLLRTWTAWNEAILDFADRHGDRCVLIESAALLSDPVSVIDAIEGGLGITFDTGASQVHRSAWIWTAAARVADRRNVHRRVQLEPVHKLLDALPVDARLLLGELDRRAAAADTRSPRPLSELVPERRDLTATTAVAAVITCRDDGPLLVDALASVRCCRPSGVETVVVDRASTDPETRRELDRLEAAGVNVVRIGSSSRAEARNIGLAATTSPIVVFLEGPDLLRPGFVSQATARFDASKRLAMVRGGTLRCGGDGVDAQYWPEPRPPAGEGWSGGGAVRRDAVSEVGGFDPDLRAPRLELWDLELSLLRSGWEITRLDTIGFDCRTRSQGGAGVEVGTDSTPMAQVIAKHRVFLASSPSASMALLQAADDVVAQANNERDEAVATLHETRERMSDLIRRSHADLTTSAERAMAAEARAAAMGRQIRMLEERMAEVIDEVARRERSAEAARARTAEEHAGRLAAMAQADLAKRESARLAAEMTAIHGTKMWRWSAAPRRAYRVLRGLSLDA